MPDEQPRPGWLGVLGWAAYLACSWTWCIGMFLPVLLLRDYGRWGFVVFAVPNVIGAAAMGWVLRTPERSRQIVACHTAAIRLFSLVTIAFHAFWLDWICRVMTVGRGAEPWWMMALIVGAAWMSLPMFWNRGGRSRVARLLASLAWLFGLVLLGLMFFDAPYAPSTASLVNHIVQSQLGVLWLAPVCAFGFALCPYLDGTFHLASQQSGDRSRASFSLGFGVLFVVMILLTYVYAGPVSRALTGGSLIMADWMLIMLGIHWCVQSGFTIGVHGVSFDRRWSSAAIGAIVVGFALAWIARSGDAPAGTRWGEVIYRCFMACYGFVFPAYVWLCMIPTGDGHSGTSGGRGRAKLVVLMIAVCFAAPCYWLGFIAHHEHWLVAGLFAVILARLFLPRGAAHGV